jgi:anaerobic magnesium-protoporphyrin IX monomethyl ester cyclase
MKICLIEPRPPGVNVYDMTLLPRLGLPLIGGLLCQRGHDVVIYCEMLAPVDWGEVAEWADVVGFSCTTSTAPAAYIMAARARLAGIPTVIGGPHVTFLPDEALDHCDYVVRGEGQVTMLELVEALAEGRDRQGPSVPASRPREERLRAILGLSYQDSQGRKVHNPPRSPCSQEEFAALPPPDLSLIVGHERMEVMPIMTQWGCPFNCDFCSVIQMFGRKVRYRHVADVLDELEQRRPAYVFFYDDNFVVDRKRTVALLQGVIERGLSFKWTAQMRADTVYKDRRTGELDHGLLRLMRDSGCFMVFCGFESANPATLVAYNKRQSIQTITDSIRAFHAYGIYVHGMFVLGSDKDDVANIRYTVDFALRNKIDTVQFLILTPCPGTPFYERMEREGRILSYAWELYDGHHTVMQPARMSPYALQMETYRAMARFYSNWQIARLAISQVVRSAPYLLWLALREYKLSLQLPWLTLLSLIPQQRERALRILQGTLSRRSWEALQRRFTVAALRKYGHDQIRKWARQAHSLDYLEKIRGICAYAESKTMPRG